MARKISAGIGMALLLSLAIGFATGANTIAPQRALGQIAASSPGFTSLYAFEGRQDGDNPLGGLVADNDGNVYGTTYYDGACAYCGTVFMLKRPKIASDPWAFSVIYSFPANSGESTGALTIKAGAIYGTAGTEVFRLRPLNEAKTLWKHTSLHRFNPLTQQRPDAGVVFGSDGALYGSTSKGGKHNSGTIFRLSGAGDRLWTYELLYSFERSKSNGPDGSVGPEGEFLIDPATNIIYGTTYSGGRYGQGTVFQLALKGGAWEHTVLHDFMGIYVSKHDGSEPRGRLVFGADGAIYGTTDLGDNGGFWNQGTVYRLQNGGGNWSYSILHEFMGGDKDGSHPKSGLTLDNSGNFIGTTSGGGPNPYQGVVYELLQVSGKWKVGLLYSFKGRLDGAAPWSQPILSKGALYGTSIEGGRVHRCNFVGCGTVYRIQR